MSQNKESGFGILKGITQQAYDLVGKEFGLGYEDFSQNLKDSRNSEYLVGFLSEKGVNIPNRNFFVESLVRENGGNIIPSDKPFSVQEPKVSPFVPTASESMDLIKRGKWGEFIEANKKANEADREFSRGMEVDRKSNLEKQIDSNPDPTFADRLSSIARVFSGGFEQDSPFAKRLSDEDLREGSLRSTASNYRARAKDYLQADREKREGDIGGVRLLNSFGRKLSDPDVYTLGASTISNTSNMIEVVNKLDKLGGDTDKLSKVEQDLLEAYFLSEAAAANFGGGNWAVAGETIAEAIPFMIEMALTGGIGGAVRVGTKEGLQKFFSNMAAKYADNLVGKALNSTIRKASAKLGSSLSGRVLEGYARAPFQLTTYGDIVGRNLGDANIGTSEDGSQYVYQGQTNRKGWGESVAQGITSKAVENFTEMSTIPLLKSVGGVVGKGLSSLVSKSPTVAKIVEQIGTSGVVKTLGNVGEKIGRYLDGNPIFSKRMRETFGVSNIVEEWTEEQLATVLHALHGEGKLMDLFDGDKQAVILLSTIGMMGAPTVVNVGSRIKGQVDVNRKYKSAVDDLYSVVADPMEEMSDVRVGAAIAEMEQASDIGEVYDLAMPILNNKNLDPKKKVAFNSFIDALAEKRAFEMSANDFDQWRKDGYRKTVDEVSNPDTGKVTVVRLMDGEEAYVVGGLVVVDDEGDIDSWMSDNSVYVEHEDGTREQLQIAKIKEVLEDQSSDAVYQSFSDGYDEFILKGGVMEEEVPNVEEGSGEDDFTSIESEIPQSVSSVQRQSTLSSIDNVQDYFGERIDLGSGNFAVVRVKNTDGSHTVDVFNQNGELAGEDVVPAGMIEQLFSNRIADDSKDGVDVQSGDQVASVVDYPRDKNGNINYEQITDPQIHASALIQEFGDDAISLVEELRKEIQDEMNSIPKIKNVYERKRKEKEIQVKIIQINKIAEFVTKENTQSVDSATNLMVTVDDSDSLNSVDQNALASVPDVSLDRSEDARLRGWRKVNGNIVYRNRIVSRLVGNDTMAIFGRNDVIPSRYAIISARDIQASHVGRMSNAKFFLNEAQPKERTDIDSELASNEIANAPRVKDFTINPTAYVGMPVVNERGEIIQGNNRTRGIQKMYQLENGEEYKQYIADHAEEWGISADAVVFIDDPVLVNMCSIDDNEAIRLGQKSASDTESGGVSEIKPKEATTLLGNKVSTMVDLLFNGDMEILTISEAIRINGPEAVRFLFDNGAINQSQYQSSMEDGELTYKARLALLDMVRNSLFDGGIDALSKMWDDALSASAKKALLQVIHIDNFVNKDVRLRDILQEAIEVLYQVKQDKDYRSAKSDLEKMTKLDVWSRCVFMDFAGNSFVPIDKYSSFAFDLAYYLDTTKSQNKIKQNFRDYYSDVTGSEANIFEESVPGISYGESINKNFGGYGQKNGGLESNNRTTSRLREADSEGSSGQTRLRAERIFPTTENNDPTRSGESEVGAFNDRRGLVEEQGGDRGVTQREAENVAVEDKAEFGDRNAIVSKSKKEEALQRIRARRANLNLGINPEDFIDFVTVGSYYIEGGVRKFSEWSSVIIDEVGEWCRPYLKMIYEAIRRDPDMSDLSKDMDNTVYVDSYNFNIDTVINNDTNTKEDGKYGTEQEESSRKSEWRLRRNRKTNSRRDERSNSVSDGGIGRLFEAAPPDTTEGTHQDGPTGSNTGVQSGELSFKHGIEQRSDDERGGLSTGHVHVLENEKTVGEVVKLTNDAKHIKDSSAIVSFVPYDAESESFNTGKRIRYNNDAIRLLIELRRDNRNATAEEKNILSRYVGWGGIKAILLDPKIDDGWTKSDESYRHLIESSLLLIMEYDPSGKTLRAIQSSTLNAHFTGRSIIEAIFGGLRSIGFKSGSILEPSAGIGNFLSFMPSVMNKNSVNTAVELEGLSGEILSRIHDKTRVIIRGIEDSGLPQNCFDLVVGNVPFGNYGVFDRSMSLREQKLSKKIHNYFFIKALHQAREGGIVVLVTSAGTLDSRSNEELRSYLSEMAIFMGAVRLPSGAFKNTANTEVVTDIVFLKKSKIENRGSKTVKDEWIKSLPMQMEGKDGPVTIYINEYFVNNRGSVIGEFDVSQGGLYGTNSGYRLLGGDMSVLPSLVKNVLSESSIFYEATTSAMGAYANDAIENIEYVRDGNIFLGKDGKLFRKIHLNETEEVKSADSLAKIKNYIALRDALMDLIYAEYTDLSTPNINAKRELLNQLLNSFISKYGVLEKSLKRFAKLDNDYYNVASLIDKYGKKADILTKRTVRSIGRKEEASNIEDAIAISLSEVGYVDISRMAELMRTTELDIIEIAKGLIYESPLGGWQTREEYLSGNVKKKLSEAIRCVESGLERFSENVIALEEVQPKDIPSVQIEVRIGARWVPVDVYSNFGSDLFNSPVQVYYERSSDTYKVVPGYISNALAISKYGTSRKNGVDILEAALNVKPVVVYDTFTDEYGNQKRIVNQEETNKSREKYEDLRLAFEDWIWKSGDRRERLGKLYNDKFNTTIKRRYDGSHLRIPGINGIELREHQRDAIWMLLQNKGGIIDHMVGAGKTFIMIAGAMEMRRIGIARKPMIIGLKSTIPQIVDSFRKAYPLARILWPLEKDFKKENRQKFFAKIATNDWDCIIMSHENYGKIPHDKEIEQTILQEELEAMISDHQDATDKQSKKRLEERINKLRERIDRLMSLTKDSSLTFEQMGIDHLIIDESQQFKNLAYSTKMNNIAGLGQSQGSMRSFNLLLGIRFLQQEHGGDYGTTFLSGTPISNSMVEMYLLMKYLRPEKMKELGMSTFDSWATTFATPTTDIEFTVAGDFKPKTRFREFLNVPELSMMYSEISDIRTDENLVLDKPRMQGGSYTLINIKQNDDQKEYSKRLIEFAKTKDPKILDLQLNDSQLNAAMLIVTGLSSKSAIDMRMIDSSYKYDPNGKIGQLVEKVYMHYLESNSYKGTQLIFSDLGTPKSSNQSQLLMDYLQESMGVNQGDIDSIFGDSTRDSWRIPSYSDAVDKMVDVLELDYEDKNRILEEARNSSSGFDVYNEIKFRLEQKGVPSKEIAFIHSYSTAQQKEELFRQVNEGHIRVILGSTQKLGTGVNVQKRVIALHHLDVPWRPSDMEQRNGRALRQGNEMAKMKMNNELPVYTYATEMTLDSMKYQTLAIKQRFLDQVKSGEVEDRVLREGESEDFNEIVAVLSGNNDILVKGRLEQSIARLKREKRNYDGDIYDAEVGIKKINANMPIIENNIEKTAFDIEKIIGSKAIVTIGEDGRFIFDTLNGIHRVDDKNAPISRADFGKILSTTIKEVLYSSDIDEVVEVCNVNGLKLIGSRSPSLGGGMVQSKGSLNLWLLGPSGRSYQLNYSDIGGVLLNNIESCVTNLNSLLEKQRQILANSIENLNVYNELLNRGEWNKQDELDRSIVELREIEKKLTDDTVSDLNSNDEVRFRSDVPEQQFKDVSEIKKEAIANGTFMKAPNGEPTKLTERQWLQVRTAAFKEWFGDWEKAARIEKLRRSVAVEITGEEYVGRYELDRDSAKSYIKDHLRGNYTINDTGETILLAKDGAQKVTSHSMGNEAHLKSIVAIPLIIENSIFIDELPNEKNNGKYKSYRYYVCGLNIGGIDYTVKTTIGVDENGDKYYDHALTEIEKGKLIDEVGALSPTLPSSNKVALSEYKDTKLLSILQTNSSKVVDKNGEPMVVRHGTNSDFSVFEDAKIGSSNDSGWLGRGFYFYGETYKADGYGTIKLDCYLNIRNPYYASSEENNRLAELNDMDASSEFSEDLKSEEYDGVYYDGDLRKEIVVFYSNQIKSAADNIGSFDSVNDDIRFKNGKEMDWESDLEGITKTDNGDIDWEAAFSMGRALNDKARSFVLEETGRSNADLYRLNSRYYREFNEIEKALFDGGEFIQGGRLNRLLWDYKGLIGRKYGNLLRSEQSHRVKFPFRNERMRLDGMVRVAQRLGSGGVSSMDDVRRLRDEENVWYDDRLRNRLRRRSVEAKAASSVLLAAKFGVRVHVIEDLSQVPSDKLRGQLRANRGKGYFDTRNGEVYVVVDNNRDVADVEKTVLHEVLAHKGLRELFGERFDVFLDNVYANARKEIRDEIDREVVSRKSGKVDTVQARMDTVQTPSLLGARRVATEEYMARLAERGFTTKEDQGFWDKVREFFVEMLAQVGVRLSYKLTNNDLRYILWKSGENLKKGGGLNEDKDFKGGNDFKEDKDRETTVLAGDLMRDYGMQRKTGVRAFNEGDNGFELFRLPDAPRVPAIVDAMDGDGVFDVKVFEGLSKVYEEAYLNWLSSVGDVVRSQAEDLTGKEGEMMKFVSGKGLDAVRRNFIDEDRALLILQDWVAKVGGSVRDSEDMYNAKNLSESKGTELLEGFREKQVKRVQKAYNAIIDSGALRSIKDVEVSKEMSQDIRKIGLYLQALDIVEAEEMGLVDRGRGGFEELTGVEVEKYVSEFDRLIPDSNLLKELTDSVKSLNQYGLDVLLEFGLLTRGEHKQYSDRQHYVPQRGWDQREREGGVDGYSDAASSYGSSYNGAIKRAKGRESLGEDPLAYMQSIVESAILSGVKNWYKQYAYRFVHGNREIGDVSGQFKFEKVYYVNTGKRNADGTAIYEVSYVRPSQDLYDSDKEIQNRIAAIRKKIKNLNQSKDRDRSEQLQNDLFELEQQLNVRTRNVGDTVEMRTTDEKRQHFVEVYVDGEPVRLWFAQPRIANTLNKTTEGQAYKNTGFFRAMGSMTRFYSAMRTHYDYVFAIKNFTRDVQFATDVLFIEEGPEMAAKFWKNMGNKQVVLGALHHVLGRSDDFEGKSNEQKEVDSIVNMFFEDGASTGYSYLSNIDNLRIHMKRSIGNEWYKRLKNGSSTVVEWLSAVAGSASEFSELVTRLSIYKSALDVGKSRHQAAILAKNATVNFNRKGSQTRNWSSLFAFLNPTIQGIVKGNGLFKKSPVKFAVVAGLNMMLGFVSTFFMAGGDDEEDDRNYTMYHYLTNWIGVGGVYLAMPHYFRAFGAMGALMGLYLRGKIDFSEMAYWTVKSVVDEVSVKSISDFVGYDEARKGGLWFDGKGGIREFFPSSVQGVADLLVNRNFMGSKIYREGFGKSAIYQSQYSLAKERDSEFSKMISRWLLEVGGGDPSLNTIVKKDGSVVGDIFNQNSSQIDYFISEIGGSAGKSLLDLFTMGVAAATMDSEKLKNTRIYRAVIKPIDKNRDIVSRYYDLKDYASRGDSYLSAIKKASKDDKSYIQSMREFAKSDEYKRSLEVKRLLKKYDNYSKEIESTTDKDSFNKYKSMLKGIEKEIEKKHEEVFVIDN